MRRSLDHRPLKLPSRFALSCALLTAPIAVADEPNVPDQSRFTIGIIVTGGVSLGTFEAGYLYYLSEFRALNPALLSERVFTGASAGSANAILALMSSCSPPIASPRESGYWKIWVPLGYERLYKPEDATPLSALSPQSFASAKAEIKRFWDQGLDEHCDALLGVPSLRIHPKDLTFGTTETLPRGEERFVLRVRGRGPGKPPLVTNYTDLNEKMPDALLPTDESGAVSLDSITQILFGSSAYLLAFAPVPVAHCLSTAPVSAPEADKVPLCLPSNQEVDLFSDGGAFNNKPLRLNVHLSLRSLEFADNGTVNIRPRPDLKRAALPPQLRFMMVDPQANYFPEHPHPETDNSGVIDMLEQYAGSFLDMARVRELQAVFEEYPELLDRTSVTRAYYPLASSPLGAFLGFFEEDFRRYDFYLGMENARRFTEEIIAPVAQRHLWGALRFPEDTPERQAGTVAEDWKPYRCMRAVFDGEGDPSICSGTDLSNFRVLMQVSLDRLYSTCRAVTEAAQKQGRSVPGSPNAACARAMLGNPPPHVPETMIDVDWRLKEGESDTDYTFRRLADQGFVYRDLGLAPDRSNEALERIVNIAERISSRVGSLQPHDALLTEAVGRLALQQLDYVPPAHDFHAMAGDALDLGYTFTGNESRVRWLRVGATVTVEGISTYLSSTPHKYHGLAPLLTFEWEPPFLTGGILQLRLGLHAGYLFSNTNNYGLAPCDPTAGTPCSRPLGEAYIAATVVQWIRLQIGVRYYPAFQDSAQAWEIRSGIGVELDLPL
jgi:hypothetical protein